MALLLLLFAALMGGDALSVVAEVPRADGAVHQGNTAVDERLPHLLLNDSEEDHHRMGEAVHGAHLLAQVGAGYEAARVLAAIASQARDSDPGNESIHILSEWGLTVEEVRQGSANEIQEKIAKAMQSNHRSGAALAHIRNLIELELYHDAAHLLRKDLLNSDDRVIEKNWGEILHRYRLPIELLHNDIKDAETKLVSSLQAAHQQNQIRSQIRFLRVIDPEASELARWLLWRSERDESGDDRDNPDDRADRDEEHRSPFERWVEGHHDEPDRDEHRPSIEELVPHVIHRAIGLADQSKASSRMLAMLVVRVAPESESADKARSLIRSLAKPVIRTLGGTIPVGKDSGAEMFETSQVRQYHLELSDGAIEQLHESPKHYVRATFREGEEVYRNVGVKLKGGWGSFRMLDGHSKAAFTVKFNQFVKDMRFHGLRRIILNNAVQDPSYIRESVGYSLFRDAGVPAPRVNYATLTVNKESYGLYVQIEAVTKDFLDRWYANTNGNLYEGPGDVMQWSELDLDSNQGLEDRSDLRRLAKSIERADDDNPWRSFSDLVDLDSFTRFIALEQIVNHWDGYTQTNNYRMYNNPETAKFEFFPHGADQLFEELESDVFRQQGGILSRALVQTELGKERYRRTMYELLDQVWDEGVIRKRIASAYRLIRPYVTRGSGNGRGVEEFEGTVRHLLRFVTNRRYFILSQLQATEQGHSWRERREDEFGFHSFLHRDLDDR